MAAELIEAGVDVSGVYRRLYEGVPLGKLTLLAPRSPSSSASTPASSPSPTLSAEDFERADAEESYSEGIIDQLRALQGTRPPCSSASSPPASARASQVSLRATGDDVDVSVIARAQGGGGHRRAAGFTTTLDSAS